MPKWSGYHVKTDGRTYFRLRVPKDLHSHFGGQWPTVNLGMKACRDAERLSAMTEYLKPYAGSLDGLWEVVQGAFIAVYGR